MTPAEELREAAGRMRERATAKPVPNTRWYLMSEGNEDHVLAPDPSMPGYPWDVARHVPSPEVGAHVASWHPAVALAVADLLDGIADGWALVGAEFSMPLPLAIARTFLGGAS